MPSPSRARSCWRRADVDFDTERTAIIQRWSSAGGTADASGYAVITGYERTLFCPVRNLPVATRVALARKSTEEHPGLLGFLSSTRTFSTPELAAGTYLVAWRAPGRLAELDTLASVPGMSSETSCFVFYDTAGLPVAAMRATESKFGRLDGPSAVTEEPDGALRFALAIPGTRREGLSVVLVLNPTAR